MAETSTLKPRRRWRSVGWGSLFLTGIVGGHWLWGSVLDEELATAISICRVDTPWAVSIDGRTPWVEPSRDVKTAAKLEGWEPADRTWEEWADEPLPFEAPVVDKSIEFKGQRRMNAVEDLVAAGRGVDEQSDAWSRWHPLRWHVPATTAQREVVQSILNENRDALRRIEAARTRPMIRWNSRWDWTPSWESREQLRTQRAAISLLEATAIDAYAEGDHATVFRRLDDLLFVAHVTRQHPHRHGLEEYFSICETAADWVAEFAGVGVHVEGTRSSDDRAVSREQVRALIVTLLDEGPLSERIRQTMAEERQRMTSGVRQLAHGQISYGRLHCTQEPVPVGVQWLVSFVVRPWLLRDGMTGARVASDAIADLSAGDWPTYHERVESRKVAGEREVHILGSGGSQWDHLAWRYYRAVAHRRLAAVALAVRWHTEEKGAWPRDVAQLVPEYLPTVRGDPFGRNSALRYVRSGDGAIVYSVGADGQDDGGSDRWRYFPMPKEAPERDRFKLFDAVVKMK